MAINYAEKYSNVVDERFREDAVTTSAVNNDFDWVGVNTVNVYSIPTVALGDYTPSGDNRYGTPSELQDTVQTMTLTQDKAFTFTIDRSNYDDTMMTKEAGKALRRQIDEQVIPTVDKYRINKMIEGAGTHATGVTPTKTNAYELFLKGTEVLGNNSTSKTGRIAYVSYKFYNFLKQDPAFVKQGDLAQNIVINGVVGYVDGVAIIPLPDSYFTNNVYFVLTHASATVAPIKLQDYKIHDNPPGINGWLIEGRIRHDAFVLNNKKMAIYTQGTTDYTQPTNETNNETQGNN